MRRHLLHWLQAAGQTEVCLFSHHERPTRIAQWMQSEPARAQVLVGFSQGGFQAVKVARVLAGQGVDVDLLVTVAAGGLGRWYPWQWGVSHRDLPAQVKCALNFYALGDRLGTDEHRPENLMRGMPGRSWIENHAYPEASGIGHVDMTRCYPPDRVHPSVRRLFLNRLLIELTRLNALT